jgi:hypothetical protein
MLLNIVDIPSRKIKDQTGQRFGRLLVVGYVGKNSRHAAIWLCVCDCGEKTNVTTGELRRSPGSAGDRTGVRSCGCLQPDRATETHTVHGMHNSAEYRAWSDMRARCSNPNTSEFKRYGARGISVCAAWQASFEAFLADVGRRPTAAHSIERIDTNGHYEPSNVKWATKLEQQRNRRCTTFVEFDGQRIPLTQVAEIAGVNRYTARARHRRGIPITGRLSSA